MALVESPGGCFSSTYLCSLLRSCAHNQSCRVACFLSLIGFLRTQGGPGWEHYGYYKPEPHILLFRRPIEVARQYDPPQNAVQEEIKELEMEQKNITLQVDPRLQS